MITKIDKNADRIKRHQRVRKKVSGTAECPRLSVFRSLNHIYAQIIDDVKGNTLVACSTVEKAISEAVKEMSKKEAAKVVGQEIAKRALEKGISKELVGAEAAKIRAIRNPEPYHGYGIRYSDEVIERKEGKTAGK